MLTRRVLMAGGGAALFAGRTAAQSSDRTIRIISGFPAGGGIDISARLRSIRSRIRWASRSSSRTGPELPA